MTAPKPRAAIVVAGGTGERFGCDSGKQLFPLAGMPALSWSILAVDRCPLISVIIIVCPQDRVDEYRSMAVDILKPLAKPVLFAQGGATRRQSVAAGLAAVPQEAETIVVHDGARPLAATELFSDAIRELEGSEADGLVVGHPSIDTLKIVDDRTVVETPDRSRFWAVQTPQVFRASALRRAHKLAEECGRDGTDDASLIEAAGGRVIVLEGPRDNTKLTLAEDVAFAEAVLIRRAEGDA